MFFMYYYQEINLILSKDIYLKKLIQKTRLIIKNSKIFIIFLF